VKDRLAMGGIEEDYLDVLQNIESAIVSVFHQHRVLVDHDVEKALDALIAAYQAEQQQRTPRPVTLSPLAQEVHDSARAMCEWRLGREEPRAGSSGLKALQVPPLSLAEVIACLKRIRKSVQRWTRREGRRGYLEFVEQYVG
jgi:hypothetical protein